MGYMAATNKSFNLVIVGVAPYHPHLFLAVGLHGNS